MKKAWFWILAVLGAIVGGAAIFGGGAKREKGKQIKKDIAEAEKVAADLKKAQTESRKKQQIIKDKIKRGEEVDAELDLELDEKRKEISELKKKKRTADEALKRFDKLAGKK